MTSAATFPSLTASARSVVEQLLIAGPLSRAELARRLSLSAASLTKITRPLIEEGYIQESLPTTAGATGRPSQPIDLDPDFAHFIGIKLTGESLFAVVTNARGVVLRNFDAYLLSQDATKVVETMGQAVDTLREGDDRIVGIGVSLSGNATRDQPIVRTSPFLHWAGVPLGDMVAARTGLPTVLDNDVRALTAAEQWFGAAAGVDSFCIFTFGAGIGCGIVSGGTQIEGRLGASGLIGHFPIDDHGPICYAGHRGCAHAYATIGGITKTISAGLGVSLLSFEECIELRDSGQSRRRHRVRRRPGAQSVSSCPWW